MYYMLLCVGGWLLIYAAGIIIPSQPFRELVIGSSFHLGTMPEVPAGATGSTSGQAGREPGLSYLSGWQLAWMPVLVLVIAISYTPTNLVLLCTFGSMLGAYGTRFIAEARRAHLNGAPAGDGAAALPQVVAVPALTAMVHGLCVYLGIVGGFIVVQGQADFSSKDPNLYLRLSAVATLFSVTAGTNAAFLKDVASALTPFTRPERGDDEAGGGAKSSSSAPVKPLGAS